MALNTGGVELVAKCLKLEYKPGSYELIQGVKGRQVGKMHGGKFFRNRGFGWGEYSEPSKLILHIQVEGEEYQTWIDRFFKDHLGALREEVRLVIRQTMPEEVEVVEQFSRRGTKYFVVPAVELQAWLARIRAIPEAEANKIKNKVKAKRAKKKAQAANR